MELEDNSNDMKFKKPIVFILTIFCVLTTSLTSNEVAKNERPLSFSDQDILHSFFANLFENTSAGYVIFGEKPVYLGNFCQPEWLMPGSRKHKEAICTFLSLKILKTLSQEQKSSNYILVIQDPFSSNIEFMLINQKAFFKVIKENLVLFKYKFGYDLTPESLLGKFTNENQTFSKLFGNEIALQGIVLGYGTNNAISFERASLFTDAPNNLSSPPNKLLPPPKTEEEMICRIETCVKDKDHWKKVKEETKDISYYHPQNAEDKLKIPFSFHPNTKETKALIRQYRKAEAKLSCQMATQNFVENVSKKLRINFQKQIIPQENSLEVLTSTDKKALSQILARSIHYTFSEQITPEFIKGMKAAENMNESEPDIDFRDIEFFEILREQSFSSCNRREHVSETRQFFEKIAGRQNICCLIPNKLYFHISRYGNSEKFIGLNHNIIEANYLIKDVEGKPISGIFKGQSPAKLDLENLLPSLAHGIMGMHESEIREVYIHPDIAYGSDTEVGNGKALQIEVELIHIESSCDSIKLPSLQPVDVIYLAPNIESVDAFMALQNKYNYFCGMKTWLHYKKARDLVSLNDVIVDLLSMKPHSFDIAKDREIISNLNWIIYQKNN